MVKKRSKKEREATAYHEAGHAVVALELGLAVKSVNIVHDEEAGRLGCCERGKFPKWFQPDAVKDGRARLRAEKYIMGSLAGVEAERKLTGRYDRVGASGDDIRADQLADYFCGSDEERWAFVKWLTERTRNLLNKKHVWLTVEAVAQALLERERLTATELRTIRRNVMQDEIARLRNRTPSQAGPGGPPG